LRFRHFAIEYLNVKVGEVRGDLFFGPADGGDEGLLEESEVAQQTGVDELHLAPEVGKRVLNRRTGEADAVLGVQLVEGLEDLALAVLDLLALVQNDVLPIDFLQDFDIAQGGLVGCQ